MLASGCYVTRLSFKQNNLFNARRPISEVVVDKATPPHTKSRLLKLEKILEFAEAAGLNASDSYRYFIEVPDGVISYTVQACPPFEFRSETWWFPFVGRVPYLGFFDKAERDLEAARLKESGFDVSVGKVGGFSSLGWFEDPVYSPMLERNDSDLALLFFHELTHRTFWQPNAVLFNEQLAEFVGRKLTREYLRATNQEKELLQAEALFRDEARLQKWIVTLKGRLEAFYTSMESREPTAADLLNKNQIIENFKTAQLPTWETELFGYVAKRQWNNAAILGAGLYTPDEGRFQRAYNCTGATSAGAFLQILQNRLGSPDSVFEDLDHLCG